MLNMLVIIQNKTVGIKVINTLSEYISDIRLLNFCNNSNFILLEISILENQISYILFIYFPFSLGLI